jgi:hypothetical protein
MTRLWASFVVAALLVVPTEALYRHPSSRSRSILLKSVPSPGLFQLLLAPAPAGRRRDTPAACEARRVARGIFSRGGDSSSVETSSDQLASTST